MNNMFGGANIHADVIVQIKPLALPVVSKSFRKAERKKESSLNKA